MRWRWCCIIAALAHAPPGCGSVTPLGALLLDHTLHLHPVARMSHEVLRAFSQQAAMVSAAYAQRNATHPTKAPRDLPRAYKVRFQQTPSVGVPYPISIWNKSHFLLLRDSQVACNGRDLLRVLSPENADFEASAETCLRDKDCDFFVWRPDGLEMRRTAWLCTGSDWTSATPSINWVVAVRPSLLAVKDFDISVNAAAPCPTRYALAVVRGPHMIQDVVSQCHATPQCTYFSIDFGGSHTDFIRARRATGQVSYLCTGRPKQSREQNGWVIGVRRTPGAAPEGPAQLNQFPAAIRNPRPRPSREAEIEKRIAENGPVTNDHYFDQAKAGEVIPAETLPLKQF